MRGSVPLIFALQNSEWWHVNSDSIGTLPLICLSLSSEIELPALVLSRRHRQGKSSVHQGGAWVLLLSAIDPVQGTAAKPFQPYIDC